MQTSITTTEANKLLKSGRISQQIGCSLIKGFQIIKIRDYSEKKLKHRVKIIKAAAAFRYRYTDLLGKRHVIKIGEYPAMKPQQAAEIALEWRVKIKNGEPDPLEQRKELAAQKRTQAQEEAQNQYRNTGRYFEVYRQHLLDNYRTGHEVANKIKSFSFLFDRDMDKITPQDMDSWYREKQKAGLKRQSLTGYLGAFKAMLNFAAGTKKGDQNNNPVIDFNPLRDYSLPRPNNKERELMEQHTKALEAKRDMFSDTVREGIMNGLNGYAEHIKAQRRRSRKHGKDHLPDLDQVAYPHWFIPFAHIARLTGMRPSDIRALRWEQINHNQFNGHTTLEFTPQKTKDKGEKPVKVRFPVDGELLDILNKWQSQQGNPATGFLFQSSRTGGQIERKAYLKHWAHVLDIGKLPEDLDFYSFRHNFISSLVKRNVPLIKIARLVGHTNTDMIVRYYLREDEEDMLEVATLAADGWGQTKQTSAAKAAGGE